MYRNTYVGIHNDIKQPHQCLDMSSYPQQSYLTHPASELLTKTRGQTLVSGALIQSI